MNTPEGSTNLVTLAISAKIHVDRHRFTHTLASLEVDLYVTKSEGQS